MSTVVYDMSMSLDGFVTAAGITPEEPLGAGGERLHEWAISDPDPQSKALLDQNLESVGAMITGRTTYDASLPWWGEDGPSGELRLPLYVVTHRETPPPLSSAYIFVTDGIDSAVRQAKETAGDKIVAVSGVDVVGQLLRAGHVDEIWIRVTPFLFGDGTRLYEHVGQEHFELELIEAIPTPKVVHLHYRVLSPRAP